MKIHVRTIAASPDEFAKKLEDSLEDGWRFDTRTFQATMALGETGRSEVIHHCVLTMGYNGGETVIKRSREMRPIPIE